MGTSGGPSPAPADDCEQLVEAVQLLVVAARAGELGRVGVDEEDMFEVGALVEAVGDALEALRVRDEDLRAGVLQAVDDLVGGPPAVEPDEDRADVDGAPERQAPLGVVLAQHRDAIAVADAERLQPSAGRVRAGDEVLNEYARSP